MTPAKDIFMLNAEVILSRRLVAFCVSMVSEGVYTFVAVLYGGVFSSCYLFLLS